MSKTTPEQAQRFRQAAEEAARIGAEVALKHFKKLPSHDFKSNRFDIVTKADQESELAIRAYLERTFPDHTLKGEEGSDLVRDSPYSWFIDPIDGTANFSKGFPYFCISVGVAEHGEPVAGAVFNPISQEMFSAAKGCGATCNGEPIKVSDTAELSSSFLINGLPSDRKKHRDTLIRNYGILIERVLSIKCFGAAALDGCQVARGRAEVSHFPIINAWDVAAATIIVREAGGEALTESGAPWTTDCKDIVCTNGKVSKEFLAAIMGVNDHEH
ncbi:MAG: inositol monophosphatase family protein [archaeon]